MKTKKLLHFELSKLVKDYQFRFILIFIFFFLLYKFIGIDQPVDISFAGWSNSNTTDSVLMILLIGVVTATVFASDYSNRTYKNFLPYVNKIDVFISKVIVNFVGIFIALAFWYIIVFILSGFVTREMDLAVIRPLILRFITQYLLVVFHASFIIIAGIITKSRAIANSFTILSWLVYSFIPFKGQFFFDYIVSNYNWNDTPNVILCISFIGVFGLLSSLSYMIFNKQEVVT